MTDAPLKLHRTVPPAPDPGSDPPRWQIAPGVWIVADKPRRIDPPTVSALEVLAAVDDAAQTIFDRGARAALERVTGLRAGSVNQWIRREQIPPPGVVAWLAWAVTHPEPLRLGAALRLAAMDPDAAREALDEALTIYLPEARR